MKARIQPQVDFIWNWQQASTCRLPVPADATSWRHTSTHSIAIQLYLDQGTLPDLGLPYAIWNSGGADSQLVRYLNGWPWVTNQHYFFVATNTSAVAQTLTLNMDGRNAVTDDTDGDGLPDGWEILYFGNLLQDGSGDYDGDGINNATEFAEGTNPANAASFKPRLVLTVVGLGNVIIEPNLPSYTMGQLVSLTAVPDAGQFFDNWSGSASGIANPLSVTMSTNKLITATFTGEAIPLVFTNAVINGSGHFAADLTGPAGSALVILVSEPGRRSPLTRHSPAHFSLKTPPLPRTTCATTGHGWNLSRFEVWQNQFRMRRLTAAPGVPSAQRPMNTPIVQRSAMLFIKCSTVLVLIVCWSHLTRHAPSRDFSMGYNPTLSCSSPATFNRTKAKIIRTSTPLPRPCISASLPGNEHGAAGTTELCILRQSGEDELSRLD